VEFSFPYQFVAPVRIPDRNLVGVYQVHPHNDLSEEQIISDAISQPIGAPRLRDLVKPGEKVLLLPDDITRMTPADRIFPHILAELAAAGVSDDCIHVLISLGTHRKMTEAELTAKLGAEVMARFKVINHHWEELENLYPVGESRQGVPIFANKEALWADHIIGVGCIFPHAVAGFSGGGKIVIPGITGEDTCGDMHWAMYGIRPKDLYGHAENPVRDIIDEMSLKVGLDYIVDAILDDDGRVVDMVVGHPVEAHRAGCKLSAKQYGVKIPCQADIVIFDSYGTDIEYWQAIKAITPAGIVLKEGGIAIQVASCPEGISVSHPEVLEFGYRPVAVVAEMMRCGLVNKSVAAHMIQASEVIVDHGRGFLISSGVTPSEAVRLGFLHAETVQEALDRAMAIKGPDASIIVLTKAGDLLPIFE
jgi:nickel-dependent lactate racemase